MHFERFYDDDLAQATYAVACEQTKRVLIVDPLRDFDRYLDWAQGQGYAIGHVAETHIHADFLSGARQLARATGAELLLSGETDEGDAYRGLGKLRHRALRHRDTFEVGTLRLQALHTPGHSPEHLCFSVLDDDGADRIVLTGDFLFVDELGRPDVVDDGADLAHQMYAALRRFVEHTSPFAVVWPGHGAGSACGKSIGRAPMTSVGREAHHAWWARYIDGGDEEGFVRTLLEGQPEVPRYFERMKKLNRDGTSSHAPLELPARLTPREFAERLPEALVIDTRDKEDFAHGHVEGAWNVALSHLSTYGGGAIPDDAPLTLVCPERDVEDATRRLLRVGLHVVGWTPFAPSDVDSIQTPIVDADETHAAQAHEASILDVRTADEFEEGHLPFAHHIPFDQVLDRVDELDPQARWIVHCSAGSRAMLAASILESNDFEDVSVFLDGPSGWTAAGYRLEREQQ